MNGRDSYFILHPSSFRGHRTEVDYKRLLTQVERTLSTIENAGTRRLTVEQIGETIATNFRDELGITGGRIYEETGDNCYEIVGRFGVAGQETLGMRVPNDYKPIQDAVENGIVVKDANDPDLDPILEGKLGVQRFAAIVAGDDNDHILAFDVAPGLSRDDILFSLSLLRYAINQRLRTERFEALIVEAQRIQQSILPHRVPHFPGFEIWGKTEPAEFVSGDFYDFIPVSENILGIAIADGSGHGLPAALVVRDIYMGLRMATDRDFKIIRTLEKLNRIIHRSRLTTKFVSLFYGELETGGILIYSNAGHNAPFVLRANNKIESLTHGGPVLGPTPDATFTRGFVQLQAGDLLCLYSDGIVEAHDRQDREFSLDRFQRIVRATRNEPAEAIGREVLSRVRRWGRKGEDDRTVVIVKALG